MTTNAVEHIEKRHGENGVHDQSMKNPNDLARIKFVIQNYDNVEDGRKASGAEGQQLMYDYVDLVGTFETPEKINVLSPAGQDQVVDMYHTYLHQVAAGDLTAEEAAKKTYDAAKDIFEK